MYIKCTINENNLPVSLLQLQCNINRFKSKSTSFWSAHIFCTTCKEDSLWRFQQDEEIITQGNTYTWRQVYTPSWLKPYSNNNETSSSFYPIRCNCECLKNNTCHDVFCLSDARFFVDRIHRKSQFSMDLLNGIHVLQHYISTTWWQWKLELALLFWRFLTAESQLAACDGKPVWRIDGVDLPNYKQEQRKMTTNIAQQLAIKIAQVRKNNYIASCGPTLSNVNYFGTIKIHELLATGKIEVIDIRVVYDVTASGLNNTICAPNFWLPTIDCALRGMNFGSWVISFDLGDMFLNFPLSHSLQLYVEIRMEQLHKIIESMEGQPLIWTWESWVRYLMGFTASPFCTIKTYYHAEEFIVGDPKEKGSPVRWD